MEGSDLVCVNCGTELKGSYCYQCGEKKIAATDKKLTHFLEEAISSVFVADGKFFKTIKLLVSKPGELTKSFVKGIRKKYLSPLQVFFFANLIYFIFPMISTFNTSLEVQMNRLPYSDITRPVVENYISESGRDLSLFTEEYEGVSSSNGKLLLIFLVVLHGLFLKLLFLKKNNLYLVDFFAGSAYFYGFYILVALILFPAIVILLTHILQVALFSLVNELILSIAFLMLVVFYVYLQIRNAYNTSKLGGLWRSLMLAFFIIPSLILYRFILFWVTFLMVT